MFENTTIPDAAYMRARLRDRTTLPLSLVKVSIVSNIENCQVAVEANLGGKEIFLTIVPGDDTDSIIEKITQKYYGKPATEAPRLQSFKDVEAFVDKDFLKRDLKSMQEQIDLLTGAVAGICMVYKIDPNEGSGKMLVDPLKKLTSLVEGLLNE